MDKMRNALAELGVHQASQVGTFIMTERKSLPIESMLHHLPSNQCHGLCMCQWLNIFLFLQQRGSRALHLSC